MNSASRAAAILTLALCTTLAVAAESDVTPSRQAELKRFVRQECGFCHGLRLTGGLGSPLTREALMDKDFDGLVATTLQGRPGTAMPGWRPYLTQKEAEWIVRSLQQGFPE